MNCTIFFWEPFIQMHSYDWGPGMSEWGFRMGWFLPPIIMLIALILVIFGIVYLIRRKSPPGAGEDSALNILKKRYARGEIGKEEFEEKRRHIES
ncbi:MAG: SHOCT domain-containing protein [Candidatus Sulfobium sp.]|jgi:putative membrane protein